MIWEFMLVDDFEIERDDKFIIMRFTDKYGKGDEYVFPEKEAKKILEALRAIL